ncbi:pentatricopeptide repeat-containing protein, partial [Tanacetum coccineum]
ARGIVSCRVLGDKIGLRTRLSFLYVYMDGEGFVLNEYSYGSVLKSCAGLRDVRIGVQVHGSVVKSRYEIYFCMGNALIDMYVKCGNVGFAQKVFDGMRCNDVEQFDYEL